jgi:hypothetical protein
MWLMEKDIVEIEKKTGKGRQFSPLETSVITFFRRNTLYLQSALILASMGFLGPTMSLQRTAYETILRGYYFIVNPEEASAFIDNFGTENYRAFLKSKAYFRHNFLCQSLYEPESQKEERRFYDELSKAAHTEIQGLLLDFPKQDQKAIEDKLSTLLMMCYGTIQMFAEVFLYRFNRKLKLLTRGILLNIVSSVGNQIPLFEPDQKRYNSKLNLRKGNFMKVII